MKRETIDGYIRDAFPEAEDQVVKDLLAKVMEENGKDVKHYKSIAEKNDAELEELRAKAEEFDNFRKATMTDEEKRKELDEKNKKLENELQMKLNRVAIERNFVVAGISEDDYSPLLDSIVTADEKASKAAAGRVIEMLTKTKEQTEKNVRAQLIDETPKPPSGNTGSSQVTKEQFDSMTFAEMVKLKNDSPELYEQFTKGD